MPQKRGPWTIVKSRVAYKNPWIEVREDIVRAGKKKGLYGVLNIKAGSTVIPLDERGNVYLVNEYHYGINKTTLEAIGGGQEKGQSPLATAKRELLEEAGIKAKKWTALGRSDALTTYLTSPAYLYLAEELSRHESQLEDSEYLELIKMPLRRAVQLVESGKITHAATVVTLLKIARMKHV